MIENNTPWIEKYRPKKLSEIVSQEESISILTNTLKTGELPHLLLYGPPGTGKTSSILALCNELFGPIRVNERVIELNASDDRGINVVRGKIINFAKIAIGTKDSKYLCPDYKIIILDEADAMTKEAQAALRKVMEENSNITRFCIICNYINQIIEPINSRCVKIRFKPINKTNLINKLEWISSHENIKINMSALECIGDISNGDLRKSILMLQNIKYIKNNNNINNISHQICKDDIYEICKYISNEIMIKYIDEIKKNDNVINVIKVTKEIINNGYVFNSIMTKLSNYIIYNNEIDDKQKSKILFEISFIEKNINDGADEFIQLLKLMYIISTIK
jgi:replication factor C subunit 2/4